MEYAQTVCENFIPNTIQKVPERAEDHMRAENVLCPHLEEILSEYDRRRGEYERFVAHVEPMLRQLVAANGIDAYITARVKERSSLEKTLTKRKGDAKCLDDVTDVAGFRVITLFEEDTEVVDDIVQGHFQCDASGYERKGELLPPRQFGYNSIHNTIRLRETIPGISCPGEVQIRSLLQHAWAEIEHELAYKMGEMIPISFRRRFARIAGLLEAADTKFNSIRYDTQVFAQDAWGEAQGHPISAVLLNEYIARSYYIKRLDMQIRKYPAKEMLRRTDDLVGLVRRVGIGSIRELDDLLHEKRTMVLKLARRYAGLGGYTIIPGDCIWYLCFVLMIEMYLGGYSPKFREDYSAFMASSTPVTDQEWRRLWLTVSEAYSSATKADATVHQHRHAARASSVAG
jgi:ppGpp synthetase/RelA/SpoT-type nucleotidyltranferase